MSTPLARLGAKLMRADEKRAKANKANTTDSRAWTIVANTETINTLRDQDCPSCEFPETLGVRSASSGKVLRIGCTRCGYWRTAKEWNRK